MQQHNTEDRQELKQLQIKKQVHDRDVKNVQNKHFFLYQLTEMGYETRELMNNGCGF